MSTNIEKIEDLFNRALDQPAGERAAFLAEACGTDPDLLARVRSLLQAHDAGDGILSDEPRSASATSLVAEKPGDHIGNYKLLEQIGEGGCGAVYMAEQKHPVRRRVALKILKLGMDTKRVIARFEAERQALALMDHPNIAKVFDAGTTQAGRPFFVMELVRGIKITDYCEQHSVSTAQRLELMMQVCRAIQHAHQKGIIHRDIKPSNVLVTDHDGTPVPKVIDFGIAKAIEGRLTDQTLFTSFEQFIGTPAYMSPEQAQLKGLDVDTRTDIYSLGVLLYELLTGNTPFDAKGLLAAGLDEMRRTIREKEPPRPSTRLSMQLAHAQFERMPGGPDSRTAPKDLGSAGVSPDWLRRHRELIQVLRGDLDWIVMKCLEKDRTRRYETANGLAMDLDRHLKNEPIAARPPGSLYRLQKLVRRNKLLFTAGVAVLSALVVGIVASTWEAIRAVHAERLQLRLRQDADRARTGEAAQRAAAEQHLYDALLGEARAKQLTGRAGQRFESLESVTKAAAIRPSIELSDTAAAAFALTDLRDARELHFRSHWLAEGLCFDHPFVLYAARTPSGISVRRLADDREIALLRITDVGDLSNGLWLRRFDPFSRYFVASCLTKDGEWRCRVWDLKGTRLVLDVAALGSPDFTPDGQAIALLNPGGIISIKQIDSGKDRMRFAADGEPEILRFNTDGTRLAGLEPGSSILRVWDPATGRVVTAFQGWGPLCFFAWNHDGTLLAVSGEDGKISVWDVASGRTVSRLEGHESKVTALTFSHQGNLLASASWDTTLRLWDVMRGQQLVVYRTQDSDLHFSPDDRTLAYAITGDTAKLLEVAQSTGFRRLAAAQDLPKSWGADFSPDGRLLATCTSGGIAIWDTLAGAQVCFIRCPDSRGVHFQTNGVLSLLASTEGGVYRWPLQTHLAAGGSRLRVEPPTVFMAQEPFRYSAVDPTGEKILASRPDGSPPVLLNMQNPTNSVRLVGHPGATQVAWDPLNRWVATGTWKGTGVNVYDPATGQLIRQLPVKSSASVIFSPDARWLATANVDGFRLWQTGSWEPWPKFIAGDEMSEISPMAFNPDSILLAALYSVNEIRIARVPACEILATLRAPTLAKLICTSFSPDGTKLAVVEWSSGQINLWDLRSIRDELKKLNLDWDMPSFPPANESPQGILARLQIDDGPFSKEELAKTIPTRDANASTNLIDLTEYYNAPLTESWHSPKAVHNDFSELGLGVKKIGDSEFDVRGLIQIGTFAANRLSYPNHVNDIPIQRHCRRLHFLHAAVFAASAHFGDALGSYIFHYVDGSQVEVPILARKDIAGWWSQPHEEDMKAIIVWTGSNPSARANGHTLRLFEMTWENPSPNVAIRSLDFVSDKPTPGAPFLVAVTVE